LTVKRGERTVSASDAAALKLATERLIILVRDEWRRDWSLEEIALGGCSGEQVEAIRRLEAGELPLGVVDEPFLPREHPKLTGWERDVVDAAPQVGDEPGRRMLVTRCRQSGD
jgi:hypothetical protein